MTLTDPDPIAYAHSLTMPPPPNSPCSIPLSNSAREGRSSVYRHWRFQDRPLLQTLDPAVLTVQDLFEISATKSANAKCLGSRVWDPVSKSYGNYGWMTYGEVATRRRNFGVGVSELHKRAGVTEEKYGVGLWCQNRPEWQIADLGCVSQGLFTVSLYDTLGPDTTEYIINHATLVCVITSLPHIPALIRLAPRVPTLKFIICLDSLDTGEQPGNSMKDLLNKIAAEGGLSIHSIREVEALGASLSLPMKAPSPEDIITINYTSGTTGNPKGVVLTHANAVAAASTARIIFQIVSNDVLISYLPLAHIYERVTEHAALFAGCAIGYFRGDILGLVDDMKLLKPTKFNSVPRLFSRFGSTIKAATVEAEGFRGRLSRHIVDNKLASMKLPAGQATNKNAFYDYMWGTKAAAALGLQNAKLMVSGSAPIDPGLQQFFRAVFGNQFIQGYGLTETYAVALAQLSGDFSAGNCGAVTVSMEACLESKPDIDYLVTDSPNPRGELLLRGNTLFREYYKNVAETTKAIDENGWFHTGDIAEVDSTGRFKIIDRVKNVLKLAQGEYISPERIENVYLANCTLLTQAYVHGDSTQAFLVSVFGINPVTFAPFASGIIKETITPTNTEALKAAAQDVRVREAVVKELYMIGKQSKFNSYEMVRAVHLEIEPFTIDNELLTPTYV